MVRLLVAATVAALAFAGCGGSDEERVRNTLTDFAAAVADGDPEEACSMMVVEDKDRCAEQLSNTILDLSDGERERLRKLKVTELRVVGRVASAEVNQDRVSTRAISSVFGDDEVSLRKQGRHWRIESLSRD